MPIWNKFPITTSVNCVAHIPSLYKSVERASAVPAVINLEAAAALNA